MLAQAIGELVSPKGRRIAVLYIAVVARNVGADKPLVTRVLYAHPVGTGIVLKPVGAIGEKVAIGLPGIKTQHTFEQQAGPFIFDHRLAGGSFPKKHASIGKSRIR